MSYNAVILSDAITYIIGTYVLNGQENGKNKYTLNLNEIKWTGSAWNIQTRPAPDAAALVIYDSSENVEFPWQVQSWSTTFGNNNITLTPTDPIALSQPTFGLAADVVALITSCFGSVANFLRLRNQGQI